MRLVRVIVEDREPRPNVLRAVGFAEIEKSAFFACAGKMPGISIEAIRSPIRIAETCPSFMRLPTRSRFLTGLESLL